MLAHLDYRRRWATTLAWKREAIAATIHRPMMLTRRRAVLEIDPSRPPSSSGRVPRPRTAWVRHRVLYRNRRWALVVVALPLVTGELDTGPLRREALQIRHDPINVSGVRHRVRFRNAAAVVRPGRWLSRRPAGGARRT